MIHIAICDDEEDVLEFIKEKTYSCLTNADYLFKIYTYTNGHKLIEEHKLINFDIILIDIEMPDIDGLSVAKEIRTFDDSVKLIIITNRDDLVYDVFEYDISAFCRKKEKYLDFEKDLLRICRKISNVSAYIELKSIRRSISLDVKNILYFEIWNHDLYVVTLDDKIRILYTLSEIGQIIKKYKFIKCYSSYIVNIDHIDFIEKKLLTMSNGDKIPISRTYYENVRKSFYENMRTYQ